MSNVLLPADGITIRQGIYEEKSTQETELGRFIDFEDGRRFRYCKAAASLPLGKLVQASAIDTDHDETVQTAYGLSIGDKDNLSVLLSAAPTANEYADGWLVCNVGTGLGQIYRIKKNTAAYAPCKVWLYDPIIVAVAATAELTLIKNKYLDVIAYPGDSITGPPVGVPLITITSGYYGWLQTRGYCVMIVDDGATVVVGNNVIPGNTDAGAVDPNAADTHPVLGVVVHIAGTDEYATIDLKLE